MVLPLVSEADWVCPRICDHSDDSSLWRRSCGGPGVLTSHFLSVGVQMCMDTQRFTGMLLYMACSPKYQFHRHCQTVAELCMHADFFRYIQHFIRQFDCINCIKMFGSGWAGSAQTPWESMTGNGRKEDWGRGEMAWTPSQTKKIWQIAATDSSQWLLRFSAVVSTTVR